ncbi:MAG: M4 family metallopeptidase, partial [Bacillota bacterium]|nr:M4 family metallopeptidase [Bacillota bacterium]
AQKNFIVNKKFKNNQNKSVIKTQQVYNGIKVKDAQQIYIVGEDGVIESVSGFNINDIEKKLKGSYKLNEREAYNIVKNDLKRDFGKTGDLSNVEKIIVPKDEKLLYAYCVKASFTIPNIESWEYFIDASTGKIIDKKDCLIYENVAVDGKGVFGNTLQMNGYRGTIPDVNITPEYSYSLADLTKTPPSGAITKPFKILTYELTTTKTTDSFTNETLDSYRKIASDNDGHFTETQSKYHAVDAHYGASKIYDFYKTKFGRYSYDNNGSNILSNCHALFKYSDGTVDSNNACFDQGTKNIFYGDGDGTQFLGFAGDGETIGHELTHAVIDSEASLEYFSQCGAIHEGLADLFGEAFESYMFNTAPDWRKCTKSYTPNIQGDYYLDFKNPSAKGFPDHMENAYNGSGDNLGVHMNAAILTKAFSLMSDGGSFHNVSVTGIGLDKVTNIMYKVITEYLTPTTNFEEFAESSLVAATALYGASSAEYSAVKSGLQAVGILNDTTQWKKINESPFSLYAKTYATSQESDKVYVLGGQKNNDGDVSNEM